MGIWGHQHVSKPDEQPESGLEPSLSVFGRLGLGIHVTAPLTSSPPPRSAGVVRRTQGPGQVGSQPGLEACPHPTSSPLPYPKTPSLVLPLPLLQGVPLGQIHPFSQSFPPQSPSYPWIIKALIALLPPCPHFCPPPLPLMGRLEKAQ